MSAACPACKGTGRSGVMQSCATCHGTGRTASAVRHTCPTCKRPTLTPWEKARGYQCRACTAHDES